MKKIISCLLLFYSYVIVAASMSNTESEYFMFIGNPGVGKSVLINSLIGKEVAKSGVSAGSGLTQFFSSYEHNGNYYFDTPGLADTKLREQAALEIESALKKDGRYHLFFVITLESGRVRPADVTTINTIMAAIKNKDKYFNVIINKVTKAEKKVIANDPKELANVYAAINSGDHKTDSIWYIDRDRDLEDGDTLFINIGSNLSDFIFNKSLAINIAKENVGKIEIDEFEQVKAQFEASLEILRNEIAAGNEKHKDLINRMTSLQASLDNANNELKDVKKKAQENFDKATEAEKNLASARKEAELEKERRIKAESETCTIL